MKDIKQKIQFLIDSSNTTSSECINWPFTVQKNGYGQIFFNGIHGAHRLSFELSNPNFNKELYVLHKCDNRRCVNPSHLFLGSQKENMADMFNKGRAVLPNNKGSKHGKSKLDEQSVVLIRRMFSSGKYKRKDIARIFSVSYTTVSDAISGKRWSSVK